MKAQERSFLKHILICTGTFNNSIVACICTALGKVKLTALSKRKDEFWMRLLRTDIICWKVLHGLDPRNNRYVDDNPLIQNLSAAVYELELYLGPVSDNKARQLRLQYTQNLCDTVKAISFKKFMSLVASHRNSNAFPPIMQPIARAAIGDIIVVHLAYSLVKDTTSVGISFPPNALQAAVAANQVDVVLKILNLLAKRIPGEGKPGKWTEMHPIGKAIVGALRVAVRTSRNDLGLLICNFLRKRSIIRTSVMLRCYAMTWRDCVSYGNTTLLSTLLYWKKKGRLPAPNTDLTELKLNKEEFFDVARTARPTLVRHLISTGILDPNYVESEYIYGSDSDPATPLWVALSVRAYKVAKELIICGADMDRRLPYPYEDMSAYERAYAEFDGDAQYHLLIWGADFRPVGQHGKPWDLGEKGRKPHIKYIRKLHRTVRWVSFEEWHSYMGQGRSGVPPWL